MAAQPGLVVEYYPARVTANEDPNQQGRIRIACVGLLGDDETDLPMWIMPALDWGWFVVPDVGEIIEVSCITGSAQDESRGQMSLDNLDIRWHGARFYNEDEDTPTPVNPVFTETHYGKRRGFATPFGHFLMFDDTEDEPQVTLAWVSQSDPESDQVTKIDINKDGELTISIRGTNTLAITPNRAQLRLDDGDSLDVQGNGGDATMTVGDGAVHPAIVEHLEALYGDLAAYVENAMVNTGMGPSSTIVAAMGPAPAWDPAINSTKVSIPDG